MIKDKQKAFIFFTLVVAFLCYTSFIYVELPVKNEMPVASSQNGKLLWQKYNCNACHQIYGLGGYLGPDLTNEFSRRGDQFIKGYIKSGNEIMPSFHLKDDELNDLAAFLKDVDISGSADPKSFIIHYDGTIGQKK